MIKKHTIEIVEEEVYCNLCEEKIHNWEDKLGNIETEAKNVYPFHSYCIRIVEEIDKVKKIIKNKHKYILDEHIIEDE